MTSLPPTRPDADAATSDRLHKRQQLLSVLRRHDAEAITLTSAAAVNWYLDGARTHVSLAADPVVAVRVTTDADTVLVTSNERERLLDEELPPGVEVMERAWFEPLPSGGGLDERDVNGELRALRAVLLPGERERFRALGRDTASALTDALTSATPQWTERELAAAAAQRLSRQGADPLVVLVAGESRAHPHPLPTDAALGRRAMLVACARRHGLIANITRWVSFGPLTGAERDAERRILDVEAAAFAATRPGRPLRDVLGDIGVAYPSAGFPADQWTRHHQGGAAGYAGRDPRATPDTDDVVHIGQAFAWNPWAGGAKVEDTVLLTGTEAKPLIEPLTLDERWPTTSVAGRQRPVTLEL